MVGLELIARSQSVQNLVQPENFVLLRIFVTVFQAIEVMVVYRLRVFRHVKMGVTARHQILAPVLQDGLIPTALHRSASKHVATEEIALVQTHAHVQQTLQDMTAEHLFVNKLV